MVDADDKILDHGDHIFCLQEQHRKFFCCLRPVPGFAADRYTGERSRSALSYRERIHQLVQFQIEHGNQLFYLILCDLAAVDVFPVIWIQILIHASETNARSPAFLHDRDIDDPDRLKRLIEVFCRLCRNLAADICNLFQFCLSLRIRTFLRLTGSFFRKVLCPDNNGIQADLHGL